MSEASGYLLHVDALDRDHAELFRLIQDLEAAFKDDRERYVHLGMVERLESYVHRHFDHESRLMRTHGFPAETTRAHEDEHERLLKRVQQWRHEVETNLRSATAVGTIVGFLRAWMVHHIKGKDADLAGFLIARGADRT